MSKTIERIEEVDRENKILMNSKECQTTPQTSDVSMQTVYHVKLYKSRSMKIQMKIVVKLAKRIPSYKLMT